MKFRNKKNDAAETSPYVRAQQEWSSRIGAAKSQLINWQVVALGSLLVTMILIIALTIISYKQKEYVYVAQVGPNEDVVNTIDISQKINATQAQKAYFIAQFINQIMGLPLDPVIARNNWLSAYKKVTGQAVNQLTTYAQSANPFANLGTLTTSVIINNFNAESDNSLQFTWTVTTYDTQGQVSKQVVYNGLFTVQQGTAPTDVKGILENPFGLKITYFSLNSEAQS
jgi:type IV secretion system protein TrbF